MDGTVTVRTEDVIAVGDYLKGLLADGGEGAGYEYEGAYRVLSMLGLTDVVNDREWDEIRRDLGVDGPEGLREHLRGRVLEDFARDTERTVRDAPTAEGHWVRNGD